MGNHTSHTPAWALYKGSYQPTNQPYRLHPLSMALSPIQLPPVNFCCNNFSIQSFFSLLLLFVLLLQLASPNRPRAIDRFSRKEQTNNNHRST